MPVGGVDHRELRRRAAAVQDEDVHVASRRRTRARRDASVRLAWVWDRMPRARDGVGGTRSSSYAPTCLQRPGADFHEPGHPIRVSTERRSLDRARIVEGRAAARREQLAQHRAVAARLVLAVAADREVARATARRAGRACGSPPARPSRLGTASRTPPSRARVSAPWPSFIVSTLGARFGIPDVVPVLRREPRLRHAARRAAHRADAQALAGGARGAEADDADRHDFPFCAAASRSKAYLRTFMGGAQRAADLIVNVDVPRCRCRPAMRRSR